MRPEDVEKKLLELEDRFWSAIKRKEGPLAASLSRDPTLIVGAQGIGELDRATLAGMLEGAPYELTGYSFEDALVRPVADGVVVVAYKVKEDLVVDGERVELEAFDSSVWVSQGDTWLCALHTESLAGDPFGRK
jgi:hypothetical protein